MKKLKHFWNKTQVIYTITRDTFRNLYQVSRVIAAQDLDLIKKQELDAEEEKVNKQIEEEMDAMMQPPPPNIPAHKMIGGSDGDTIHARPAKEGELDPKNFITEIPEEKIMQAHKVTGGINQFTRLLYTAEIFREAGMTPMFLTNKSESIIRVAAEETWMKPNVLN